MNDSNERVSSAFQSHCDERYVKSLADSLQRQVDLAVQEAASARRQSIISIAISVLSIVVSIVLHYS